MDHSKLPPLVDIVTGSHSLTIALDSAASSSWNQKMKHSLPLNNTKPKQRITWMRKSNACEMTKEGSTYLLRGTCMTTGGMLQRRCDQIEQVSRQLESEVSNCYVARLWPLGECYYLYYSTLYFISFISLSHDVLTSSLFTIMYFTI